MSEDTSPDAEDMSDVPAQIDEADEAIQDASNSSNDPLFGLLLAGAVAIGLIPIADTDADLRYTIVWGMLALFGVLAWLLGNVTRIDEEAPEDLAWGVVFGLIFSIPILAFAGQTLTDVTELMFPALRIGGVLAYLVFVMPVAETLFFRSLMQNRYAFWLVALIATLWQLVLFFPLIDRGPLPLVTGVILLMANLLYGYVCFRNGLAAAWLCQITVNLILFSMPFTGLA